MRLLLVVLFVGIAGAAAADPRAGRVVDVLDGDTINIVSNGKSDRIRLAGIDAPEIGQPGGAEATRALRSLVENQIVTLRIKERGRYGRLIARVMVHGIDTSVALLMDGHAWHYKRYDQDAELAAIEAYAKHKRLGLWAENGVTPPWQWRKERR